MRYLLDTNVLFDPFKRMPNARVAAWLRAQRPLDLCVSVLTIGEIASGVLATAPGRRRSELERWVARDLPGQFAGRVLEVDIAVATEWGRLTAEGRAMGRELPAVDGLLLATAAVHHLTFVTRNESDCADRGVEILNPFR